MWSQKVDKMFWPFAIKAAAERMNSLHIDTGGHIPESKFYGVNIEKNKPIGPAALRHMDRQTVSSIIYYYCYVRHM
jgi:hypothetical protein